MTSGSDKLLRRSLAGNAVFSAVSGLAAVLFSRDLAGFMEVSRLLLTVMGLGVLAFGLATAWVATREVIDPRLARAIVLADFSWIIGAATLLLFTEAMSDGGRALLGGVSLIVGFFAILEARGIRLITGPKRLETAIAIEASPEDVWEVLTSFEGYADWNPHITRGEGLPRVGENLVLQMSMGNGRSTTMRPTVTEAVPGRAFEWLGHVGVKGIFDGRHRFELQPAGDKTRLVHSEEFTGVLVPVLARMLDGNTLAGFEAMNEALKNRAESKETQGA